MQNSGTTFKDNFSKQADIYAQYRPLYPDELFLYLSSLIQSHTMVWDCGTGSGQCAIQLAKYFDKVFASDPSQAQIDNSYQHEKIVYKVEPAEYSSLENDSVDLIVVAQALHWFNQIEFFEEAKRVLKKNGIIAIISYVNPVISKEIDTLTDKLHDEILKEYWRPENKMIFEQYRDIEFPFQKFSVPEFKIEKALTLAEFIGHLRSWSAVQRFIDKNNFNPLVEFENATKRFWEDGIVKMAIWNLHLIVGTNG